MVCTQWWRRVRVRVGVRVRVEVRVGVRVRVGIGARVGVRLRLSSGATVTRDGGYARLVVGGDLG